ncbi:hypothetical protein ACTTAF_08055 [Rhodobacter capsulatus]|uniref:hypothetical protein n=1 Tax=Rhodobacter capsulatus TaxID=1061 RepID=UPI004038E08D
MRLLIADDHDLVRDAIAALLRAGGCDEVAVAGTLPEALAAVQAAVQAGGRLRSGAARLRHAGDGRARGAGADETHLSRAGGGDHFGRGPARRRARGA